MLVALIAIASPAYAQSNPADFGTYSIGHAEIALFGDFSEYVVQAGSTLPPGMTLRDDTPGWFQPSQRAGISGVALTPGTYNFTLVRNGIPEAHTVKITALSLKEYYSLPDQYVDKAFSYQLVAQNNAGPVTYTPNGVLPPGVSLSAGGLISGDPTTAGFYNINFSMNDGTDTIFRSVSVTIYAIEITSPAVLPSATQGQFYQQQLTASGGNGVYTFTSGNLPSGFTLSSAGLLSGTSQNVGMSTFTVSVVDGLGVSRDQRFSVPFLGVPPRLALVRPYSNFLDECSYATPCNAGIQAINGGKAPFTWTISGLPAGLSYRFAEDTTTWWINPGDVEIYGAPLAMGNFPITATMTDGDGKVSAQTFTLKVSPLHENTFLQNGTYGVPYFSSMRMVGGELPYFATIVNGRLPQGLVLDQNALTVSGTPQEHGSFSVLMEFTDDAGQSLKEWQFLFIGGAGTTLTINENGDLGFFTEGASISRQLNGCCAPSLLWSLVGGALPPNVILTAGGVVSGTPPVGSAGLYTFLAKVEDASNPANFAVREMRLTVTPMSLQSSTTLPNGFVGSPYSVTLVANGGSGFTWSLEPMQFMPPGIGISAGGVLSGMPTARGRFTFALRVVNSGGFALVRTFTVQIFAAGEAPPLDFSFGPNLGTNVLGSASFQLFPVGGTAPITFASVAGEELPGFRMQNGPPYPTFFPTSPAPTAALLGTWTTPGTYETTVRATDAFGQFIDKVGTVTVTPLHLLLGTLPKASLNVPYSFTLQPYGGTAYTFSSSTMPAGLSVNAAGQIQGTPTAAGTFSPSVTVTDLGTAKSVNLTLSLTVDPFAITTGGILPNGTVNVNYNQVFAHAGCTGACTWSASGLPTGFSMSAGGTLSGTTTGTFNNSITVSLAGSAGTVSKAFALRINSAGPSPLTIQSTFFNDISIGSTANYSLFVAGGTGPYTWSLDAGTLPPGMSLQGPGETLLSGGIPGFTYIFGRAMQVGVYGFTLRVTDSVGATTTRAYSLRVSPLVSHYTSLPLSGTTLVYNQAYNQPLLVVGGTGSYTWTTSGMPAGLSLGPVTGIITGIPQNTGSFSPTVTATDGNGDSFTFTLSMAIGGGTPVTLGFSSNANLALSLQGASPSFNVTPTGGTPPYTVTALTALPPGMFLSGAAGPLTGIASVPGSYSFTLLGTDSAGNIGVRTFNWTVAPFNTFPSGTTLNDATSGQPYSFQLTTLGAPGTVWAVSPTSALPAGLTLTPGGLLSGSPTGVGTFSFTVTATNGGVTSNVNLSLRVSTMRFTDPDLLPPALFGEPYSYTFNVVGGGAAKVFTPIFSNGVALSSTGVLSGMPSAGATTATLVVTVTDGASTLTRRFSLQFTQPNPSVLDIGTTSLVDAVAGQTYATTLTPTGGVAPYSWALAAGSSLPPGFALYPGPAGNTGPGTTQIAGLSTVPGSYPFDIVLTDSAGTTARRTLTLKVSSIGVVPGSQSNIVAGTAMSTQFTGVGGTGPYTFSLTRTSATQDMLPPGLTLTAGGLLSGTATSTGIYRSNLNVQDSTGATYSRLMVFTVTAAAPGNNLFINNTNVVGTIGRRVTQTLQLNSTSGPTPSSISWTAVTPLPPGLVLFPNPDDEFFTLLAGQPTTPGTFVYRLRGFDTNNPAVFAEHEFTMVVNGMNFVFPTLNSSNVLFGRLGEMFTLDMANRIAGGVRPYTFTATAPIPGGLSINPAGLISGIPTMTGTIAVPFLVTDSAGSSLALSFPITVTPPGVPPPLQRLGLDPTPGDATVGVPYAQPLDNWVRGGVQPYTWALAPGSLPLPPGLELVSGGNGVIDYLAGTPTVPDGYEFELIASDQSGQSVTVPFEMRVSTVGFNLSTLPPARVGVPYLASFGPSGGVPPYFIINDPRFDMPAGLTLSPTGVLSGTPTSTGSYTIGMYVNDGNDEFYRFYRMTVDNPSGESPAVSMSPNPIEIYYEVGSPAPVVPIALTPTSGAPPFTLKLSGAPWAGLSADAGTTPSTVNLMINPAGLAPGTYSGLLGAGSTTAIGVIDPAPVRLTVVPPPPCEYSLNPTAASIAAAGGSGGFDVATAANCAWTAVASDPWITVTAGANGSGTGAVGYAVAANGGAGTRDGTITVNGQVFTISQFGAACSFAINPLSIGAPATGGAAAVAVTASSACGATGWTATGLGATPASGSGNGTVMVTIPVNADAAGRVLTATIAGQTFTVNQSGAACAVALSAPGASQPASAGGGAVNVTTPAGCPYSTVLGPSWISVTSGGSGTGSGSLLYTVEPNSTTFARQGTLTIGGEPFTITQEALACSATLDTSLLGSPMPVGGGSGSIAITMNGPNCAWTASSGAPWAAVIPGASTGSGNVIVTVTSNVSSTTPRATELTVAGQTIALTQTGTVCNYSLLSTIGSVPSTGGSGSVGVVAPAACAWGASSNDASWLTISSSGTGGTANVSFVAQPNLAATPRSGSLTIAGLTYTVNQAAADCSYTLTPNSVAVASGGATDTFAISTNAVGCAPSAVSYASWAAVSTAFAGTTGEVTFTVEPNPSSLTRIGIIQVGTSNFTITQLGAECAYSLSSYGAYFNSLGGSSSFQASGSGLGCSPVVGVDLTSIVTLGPLGGPISNIFTQPFDVSQFLNQLTPTTRRARITFGGRIFVVKQTSY